MRTTGVADRYTARGTTLHSTAQVLRFHGVCTARARHVHANVHVHGVRMCMCMRMRTVVVADCHRPVGRVVEQISDLVGATVGED